MSKPTYIIGIGGVSRSGKSSLARAMGERLGQCDKKVTIFDVDEFVIPEREIPEIHGVTNWELPESIDWERLISDVNQCASQYIIIEGIFVFCEEAGKIPFDYRVLMEIDKSTFLKRRRESKRWGMEPAWYPEHVWESNLKLIAGVDPDLRIDGLLKVNADQVVDEVSALSNEG